MEIILSQATDAAAGFVELWLEDAEDVARDLGVWRQTNVWEATDPDGNRVRLC